MVYFGKWIAKHKAFVVALSLACLVPAIFGYANTRVNYDLLTYLPDTLETVKGQDIMVDEFGMGAFSMVIVEGMPWKDVVALKESMEGVDHVKEILWHDSFADITLPMEMLPENLRDAFNSGEATMMIALFDDTTSSDHTMEAVSQLREIAGRQCFISGMSGITTDVKDLSMSEMMIYVVIAAALSLLALGVSMDSFLVPVIFLFTIGLSIAYNLGTNIFLGEISYITQALTAVLQLGVTMDYSIFLLNSYEENKRRFPEDKERAMAHAISNTFKSVAGSSVTTIAGFLALCFMTFTLGMNIGVVMSKGVALGVMACVTILPAYILTFDKLIEKTKHKPFLPNMERASDFMTKHYGIALIAFAAALAPALYGNSHVGVYYNIDQTLPDDLASVAANRKLDEEFHMNNVHMVLMENGLTAWEKSDMIGKMEEVDGVKWVVGLNSIVGPSVPESMIPKKAKEMLKSDNYEIIFVSSDYKTATDECNGQLEQLNSIVKGYGQNNMVIGEAALTKDLVEITAIDLRNVSLISIAAIFLIIMVVFKSISIPIILVSVIEFAICVNMAVPYYRGTTIPFVASIVIGTIQLGATVDYAILMTSKYQKARSQGASKEEAISMAHKSAMPSILVSGASFFAATFGVGIYSRIDMISSICKLLSRGAIISSVVVLWALPAMFLVFDGIICRTSIGFLPREEKTRYFMNGGISHESK